MVRGISSLLDRWSLQYRITAGVGLGLAFILTLFGYVSFWSIGQTTAAALRDRERLAVTMARHVESALASVPLAEAAAAVRPLLMLPDDPAGGRLLVEVLDASGAIQAASGPPPPGVSGIAAGHAHAVLLADLIAAQEPGVRPHRPPNGTPPHIVAYAPLVIPGGPRGWGLTVEQPEDSVLALPIRLRGRMLAIGALALASAVLLAWLDARRVVGPLRRVTAAAQRIAAGDLDAPLAEGPRRQDEVGRLSVALDTMRGRLVRSLGEIREWNQELERRVRRRTQELAAIGAQHRQLLRKVIWAQEEERKRLARELHDDTVQTLSGLAMTLQAVEDGLPEHLHRERQRLAWAKEQAVHAAREIRQLILGLRPSALDDLGLIPAVRWYASTQLEPLGVAVAVEAPAEQMSLPPLVQTVAFRVIQEALTNVAKHAQARRVDIRVGTIGSTLSGTVEDDGCGFDPAALRAAVLAANGTGDQNPAAADAGRGLGLLGMEERVALLGGQLSIWAASGLGTRVEFTIPCDDGLALPYPEHQEHAA